jgi:hypothetical protein
MKVASKGSSVEDVWNWPFASFGAVQNFSRFRSEADVA